MTGRQLRSAAITTAMISCAAVSVGMVKRGARITVLTNSLAATDVGAVHAGSQRYRKPLLEAGVRLYEVKPDAIEYARCETNETKAVPHWNLPDASVH